MLSKTTHQKTVQIALAVILMLTVALAASAYTAGPFSSEHCDEVSDPLCLQALSQDAARWGDYALAYDNKVAALSQYNARWAALGESAVTAEEAVVARWEAAVVYYDLQINRQRVADAADAARWTAVEALYAAQGSAQNADAARWTAMEASSSGQASVHDAETGRWEAAAALSAAQASQQRARAADAARWAAMASF